MYRYKSFIRLQISCSMILITFILVLDQINSTSSEALSSHTWSNLIHDLSVKIHDSKSDDKTHPLNEGFILLSDNQKKPSPITSFKSAGLTVVKRISPSYNISSSTTTTTTCKTITMVKAIHNTSTPPVDHLSGRFGRRLLNDPSYDTDIEISSSQTPLIDDSEIESFLKINDEELSIQLANMASTVDGSGTTMEETTEQTSPLSSTETKPATSEITIIFNETVTSSSTTTTLTTISTSTLTMTSTTSFIPPKLDGNTTFLITIDCANASETLANIIEKVNKTLISLGNTVLYDYKEPPCNGSDKINATLNFLTAGNVADLNDLYELLGEIVDSLATPVYGDSVCEDGQIIPVKGVTSCFLIDKCGLCGRNPEHGYCSPQYNTTECRCLVNTNDPSRPYVGSFCELGPIVTPSPLWTPVIVGVLSAIAGLLCATTCCLWAIAAWRRRGHPPKQDDLRIRRIWHLPRAAVPTSVSADNVSTNLSNTLSTSSSYPTNSDRDKSLTTDSTFFKDLDQKMGANLRATIARPNTDAMLASLPADTISTISSHDPIDELDAIIDNEDLTTTFHDPLNDLFDDDDMLEAINPNLKLPRPNVDSQPTGLFSYFYERF